MNSYVVIHNSVTGIDHKENGNIINFRNRTLQSFGKYEDALAFARRERRSLRQEKRKGEANHEALYVCHKPLGGMKTLRYITFNEDHPT